MKRHLRVLIVILTFNPWTAYARDNNALFASLAELANRGNSEAQYNLGMFYNNGIGTPRDPKKAFEWFNKAAVGGDPLAAFKMGCYYGGQFKGVVDVDPKKSLEYNLIASRAGYLLAQVEVASAYDQQKNFSEAARWWKMAADQGAPGALYELSSRYQEGRGVSKDPILAYAYLKLSARTSGNETNAKAQPQLDRFKNGMSSAELAKAERFVADWKPQVTSVTLQAQKGIQAAEDLVKSALGSSK